MRRKTIRLLAVVLAVVTLACQAGLAVRGGADAGVRQPAAGAAAGAGETVTGDEAGGY